jgi:putative N-acetylmannosamine-6-phosphate epimerase
MKITTAQNWLLGSCMAAIIGLCTAFDVPPLDDLEALTKATAQVEALPSMESERVQELQKMQRQIDMQIANIVKRSEEHERMMRKLLKDAEKLCASMHGEAAARVSDRGEVVCTTKRGKVVSKPLGPQV